MATQPPVARGVLLEETSDAIDKVNLCRGLLDSADAKGQPPKAKNQFRDYENASDRVKSFYREQHGRAFAASEASLILSTEKQTFDFNVAVRSEFHSKVRARMGIWQAMEMLDNLVDNSDPDTDLTQIQHLLQTAEAIRRDGLPDWMQVVGLVHDLGKLLYFLLPNAEQWSVVGDTFPVGCAYSDKIIYPETFVGNPDFKDPRFATQLGIYREHCGINNVMMSWGHDEYLYLVLKDQCSLPDEGLAMIRYHSFYPFVKWHRDGGYRYLMAEEDEKMLQAVGSFNPYDLYSKADASPNAELLKPYYERLIAKYFPPTLSW